MQEETEGRLQARPLIQSSNLACRPEQSFCVSRLKIHQNPIYRFMPLICSVVPSYLRILLIQTSPTHRTISCPLLYYRSRHCPHVVQSVVNYHTIDPDIVPMSCNQSSIVLLIQTLSTCCAISRPLLYYRSRHRPHVVRSVVNYNTLDTDIFHMFCDQSSSIVLLIQTSSTCRTISRHLSYYRSKHRPHVVRSVVNYRTIDPDIVHMLCNQSFTIVLSIQTSSTCRTISRQLSYYRSRHRPHVVQSVVHYRTIDPDIVHMSYNQSSPIVLLIQTFSLSLAQALNHRSQQENHSHMHILYRFIFRCTLPLPEGDVAPPGVWDRLS